MRIHIVTQTPKMARELRVLFAATDRQRAANIRRARKQQGAGRYLVIDAGFPALRYLIWDTQAKDNLRGDALPGNPRHPWYCGKEKALRIAANLNASTGLCLRKRGCPDNPTAARKSGFAQKGAAAHERPIGRPAVISAERTS